MKEQDSLTGHFFPGGLQIVALVERIRERETESSLLWYIYHLTMALRTEDVIDHRSANLSVKGHIVDTLGFSGHLWSL